MRIAIISDIHSNLESLEKALALIGEKEIDKIVCLGDIVGYGANPNECLELLMNTTQYVVLGNHDEAAADLETLDDFNTFAKIAAIWTNRQLTDGNKEFIRKLPYTLEMEGLLFTHASPFE